MTDKRAHPKGSHPAPKRAPRLHSRGHLPPMAPWRETIFRVIFGVETRLGRAFDIGLIAAIILSVLVVALDSVEIIQARYHTALLTLEWVFTVIFTGEYLARIISVRRPWRYVFSLLGVVDLLAILPTYLALVFSGAHSLLVIRALRLLRVFRVFKLTGYLQEADSLLAALRASKRKIIVFLAFVLSLSVIMGALMYLIEGEPNGFTSIPRGMYWAIVTMTTVGYGDIAPQTVPGQILAAMLMILGYAILAVPTGIVSAELSRAAPVLAALLCRGCGLARHDGDAGFCKHCGTALVEDGPEA